MRRPPRHVELLLVAALIAPAGAAFAGTKKPPLGAAFAGKKKPPLGSVAANRGRSFGEAENRGNGKSKTGLGNSRQHRVVKSVVPRPKMPVIVERKIESGGGDVEVDTLSNGTMTPTISNSTSGPATISPARKRADRKRTQAEQAEALARRAEQDASSLEVGATTAAAEVVALVGEIERLGQLGASKRASVRRDRETRRTLVASIARLDREIAQLRLRPKKSRGFLTRLGGAVLGVFGARPTEADPLGDAEAERDTAIGQRDAIDQRITSVALELETTDASLAKAKGALGPARTRSGERRTELAEARTNAQRVRKLAVEARRAATEAEAKVGLADQLRTQRAGSKDQHAVRIARSGGKARARYLAARRQAQLYTVIEPKPGEVSQDAVAAAPELGLFAMADGVTNSDFSGEFARALVRRWTEQPSDGAADFGRFLAAVQTEWAAETAPLISGRSTAWYNRGKTWRADAAFVGAKLIAGGKRLQLVGTGDTVAILVRRGEVMQSFPLGKAAEFSDQVAALPSIGDPKRAVREATWDVQAGDEIFMATDALAAWSLGEREAGRDPFPQLRGLQTAQQMRGLVERARKGEVAGGAAMAVDDTSLVRFVIPT